MAPISLEVALAINQSNLDEKANPSILKDDLSTWIDPSIFTSKQNQFSFSSTEINKPVFAPVQCLIDQIQVQMPILVVATDQMPDHTKNRE